MKIGLWSTTAGGNSSTPPDGAPEGMAPSTVNDTMREMMAQIRLYCQNADYFDHGMTPTWINADSFSVPGNQLAILTTSRRLQMYCGAAGTINRNIATASFTTVTTISLGAGTAITSSLSSFAVAVLDPTNPSNLGIPRAWGRLATSVGGVTGITTYGVQSMVRSATGVYRVTYRTTMSSAIYLVMAKAHNDAVPLQGVSMSYTTTSTKFITYNSNNSFVEATEIHFTTYGA